MGHFISTVRVLVIGATDGVVVSKSYSLTDHEMVWIPITVSARPSVSTVMSTLPVLGSELVSQPGCVKLTESTRSFTLGPQ